MEGCGPDDGVHIDLESPRGEKIHHVVFEPSPQTPSLIGISAFHATYPHLKFHDGDDADVEIGRTLRCEPAADRGIGPPQLTPLGDTP
jgi:hypothetical protein